MSKWRDEQLYIIEGFGIVFLDVKFKQMLILPDHVNFDVFGNRRSSYTPIEIADMAYGLIQNEILVHEGSAGEDDFYLIVGEILGKKYKLILKFNKKKETLYVITLYRIKK